MLAYNSYNIIDILIITVLISSLVTKEEIFRWFREWIEKKDIYLLTYWVNCPRCMAFVVLIAVYYSYPLYPKWLLLLLCLYSIIYVVLLWLHKE